ncbi:haloacid dehalogenase [Pradoshia eiseniae]|uniref:Haloacid dehalogenase n=1 Tax=Pradoshia eiseniae TaxID=2064768 RepID=A0A2S7N2B7_9BACI|nr:HAD-IA family hydrolase [Pradoshia eiseniae]PQD96169.1 haloacid dehalogenase [Pradoshia eiseniae]
MIKAVIFDLDDTLISERKYIESGYRHISKLLSSKLEKNEFDLYELLIKLFSQSPKNVFNRLFDTLNKPYTKSDILELVEEYRNHIPLIEFYIDVLPCLEMLKEKGLKLGIITDGYAIAQRQKLEAVQAFELFDEIIVTDELGREYWKPHVKAFELMKERLNIEFNEMIYVGDNPEKDFHIGAQYPVHTIRIYREGVYKDSYYLNDIRENFSIHSLNELDLIIGR